MGIEKSFYQLFLRPFSSELLISVIIPILVNSFDFNGTEFYVKLLIGFIRRYCRVFDERVDNVGKLYLLQSNTDWWSRTIVC